MELTRTEFELLVALALRPGQVLTRHDLVTEVWDTTWVGDERIVDVHIGNLRRKLGTDTRGRGLSTPCVAWATGWGSHESRTRPDLPLPGRPGVGRGD